MPSINARNLSEELHERISRSAARSERSMEAEVRYALSAAYPDEAGLSLKDKWMKNAAERTRYLMELLKADGFWLNRGEGTPTQFARLIGEESPVRVLEWMEGTAALTFADADRIAGKTGCRADWLIDGTGDIFPVEILNEYPRFFEPEVPGDYEFHLLRYGRSDGKAPLLVIRKDKECDRMVVGKIPENEFCLGEGMGDLAQKNLNKFLTYIKKICPPVKLHFYFFDTATDESGSHCPVFFLNPDNDRLKESDWLANRLA